MNDVDHQSRTDAVNDLWHYYEENATQARQHENLRATASSVLVGFAAALVGLVGVDGMAEDDIPAAVLVIGIGVLGALLSLKHYERNRMHSAILKVARSQIDRLRGRGSKAPESLSNVRKTGVSEHESQHSRILVWMPAHSLWAALHLFVAGVGVLLVVLAAN